MKTHEEMEKIFGTRISGPQQITGYINSLSRMGRFDEPKKVAVLSLLLRKVAELEQKFDETTEVFEEEIEKKKIVFECELCPFKAKTNAGLKAHIRFNHKPKTKK